MIDTVGVWLILVGVSILLVCSVGWGVATIVSNIRESYRLRKTSLPSFGDEVLPDLSVEVDEDGFGVEVPRHLLSSVD